MTVHERIATAMQVLAEFDFNKSGQVMGGPPANFIPIGQILQAIRKAHAKAGLFLTIGQLEYDKDNEEGIFDRVINSKPYKQARGHSEVSINGADGDCISFVVPFNVLDNSDKLDNKIVTNIERQAYRVLYAIDEGDATDPESEWREDMVTGADFVKRDTPKADGFFSNSKRPEYKTGDKPKTATPGDPEKDKVVNDLTTIIMGGGTDCDVIMTMLNGRKLTDLGTIELKQIYEAVHPFEQKGGKA